MVETTTVPQVATPFDADGWQIAGSPVAARFREQIPTCEGNGSLLVHERAGWNFRQATAAACPVKGEQSSKLQARHQSGLGERKGTLSLINRPEQSPRSKVREFASF